MLEARVKQLKNQAHEDFRYNKSLKARFVPFLRKEAAEKEDDDNEEDQHPSHQEAAMMTAPLAPSDFPESCID
jgi:hypothetical protein